MTDLLVRPVEEQERPAPAGSRIPTKARLPILAILVGVLAGWALFANAGPNRQETTETHWQQVVDHYSQQHLVLTDAQPREAAHWQAVVDHYERQWELRNR